MPTIFFGHGSPLNAVQANEWTHAWQSIGKALPRPRAVVAVSAHWYLPGTRVTAMERPPTIHDFRGFPPELYQIAYPAPGEPTLARRLAALLQPVEVKLDEEWGLDHGTWSVLRHLFPAADIPVIQLSIDATQAPAFHLGLGKQLAPLREESVLVIGSGNIVHNLRTYAWDRRIIEPYDWALRFDAAIRAAIVAGDETTLVDYPRLGDDAHLSAPTPEHYLPLLYVMGQRVPGERVTFPTQGITGGSISMLSVQLG